MSQNLGSRENYAFVRKLLKGLSASEIFAIFAPCNIGEQVSKKRREATGDG